MPHSLTYELLGPGSSLPDNMQEHANFPAGARAHDLGTHFWLVKE